MTDRPARILVKGSSGAGKTTFARTLADRMGVPCIELDALYHGPGWTPAPADVFRRRVDGALAPLDAWVVDGDYDHQLGTSLLDRAELIVWLDLPLMVKLRRLTRRTLRRLRLREELWSGNRERWRGAFWGRESLLVWAARAHVRHRREWPRLLAGRPVVRLRTDADVTRFLRDQSARSA